MMFLEPPIKLRCLLACKSQLRPTLSVVETRPECHGQIGPFAGRQFQQVSQSVRSHASILPLPMPFGKRPMLGPNVQ
jgi:hypothetical protein